MHCTRLPCRPLSGPYDKSAALNPPGHKRLARFPPPFQRPFIKRLGSMVSSPGAFWLSKKWLAPLFRGFHSSLAPTARPGSYAEKPLLRKAFCGFAVHAAKSDYSLRGLRPPNPQGFFDRLGARRQVCRRALCFAMRCPKRALRTRGAKRPRLKGDTAQKHRTKGENKMPRLSHVMERRSQGGKIWTALAHGPQGTQKSGTSYGPSSCRMGAGPLGKAGVKPAAGLG